MASTTDEYLPGYKPSHITHHEWRTAQNSAPHLLPLLASLAESTPSFTLLDVGTGSGTIATSFAQLIPRGSVIATDISDEIVARARTLASEAGVVDNVTFQTASAYELPFADAMFDVVHAHQVLVHLHEPVTAIREMVRVTKSGGLIALREADLDTWSFWPELAGLFKLNEIQVKTHKANGGHSNGGRRLVNWAMKAGLKREQIDMNFAGWSYNKPEDRRVMGQAMAIRAKEGAMRQKAIEKRFATAEEMDDIVIALDEWIETEDATMGMMVGEAIIRR